MLLPFELLDNKSSDSHSSNSLFIELFQWGRELIDSENVIFVVLKLKLRILKNSNFLGYHVNFRFLIILFAKSTRWIEYDCIGHFNFAKKRTLIFKAFYTLITKLVAKKSNDFYSLGRQGNYIFYAYLGKLKIPFLYD